MGPDQHALERSITQSSRATLLSFSRQQKNLLLLRPLFALEFNKARYGAENSERSVLDDLDTHYLALALLDYLVESVPYYRGRTRDEVVAFIAGLIAVMANALAHEDAELAAEQVLGALENKRGNYQPFEFTYFDAAAGQAAPYRYRLLKLEPDQYDNARYAPTHEGYLVYLGMLDLRPEEYELVMQKASQLMLQRNRYAEALELISKARKSSIQHSQMIGERLGTAMRSPRSVNWGRDFAPSLDSARSHVVERQREDQLMLGSVQESLIAESTGETAREHLAAIRDVLESASTLRTQLVTDIGLAPDRFLSAHAASVRARGAARLPDLETVLLPQLGNLPAKHLACLAEAIVPVLYPPRFRRLFDLSTAVAILLQRAPEGELHLPGEDEFEERAFPPGEFSDELIELSRSWLAKTLQGARNLKIDDLIARAQEDGFDETGCRCITYWLFRTYHPATDVFDVNVSAAGRFEESFAEGSRLVFDSRAAKENESDDCR